MRSYGRRFGGAGIRRGLRTSGGPTNLEDIPGLLTHIDPEGVPSSVSASAGDMTQCNDLTGNGHHATPLGNAPAWDGTTLTFDAANSEGMFADTFHLATVLADRPFAIAVVHDGVVSVGGPNGAPRFYLGDSASSYSDLNNITHAASSGRAVDVWYHDGTDFVRRRDGVELDTVAISLVTAVTGDWQTRAGMDGPVYTYVIYDADDWDADFDANIVAMETALGV